ncbi:MAG: 50S ribosomal protein L4 [Candidatus Aenigmarchaeota archaeon]|nr:50S ribosomal protein L4 [Candidatus Aenigmarchaeota archaeon]
MKVDVLDLKGKSAGKVELPDLFSQPVRTDLIQRSSLAIQSKLRQPYGSDPMAGKRTSAHYHGKRRERHTMMNVDMARMARIHTGSPHMRYRARRVPQSVKGRRSHPPKPIKKWAQKINRKENLLAIKSAITATSSSEYVKKRGHLVNGMKLPLIVKDDIHSIKKTSEAKEILIKFGLEKELNRTKRKKVRSGKGKRRGRKYKRKVGPLIVISEDKGILKAARNIPGVNVKLVGALTIKDLAPGGKPGRLTIYSQSAIKNLEEF